MPRRPSRRLLEKLYHDQGLSLQEVGDRCGGVTKSTVLRWMKEYGIERREPGRVSQCPACDDLLELAVHRRLSVARLADHYQVSEPTVRKWLKRCEIDTARPTAVEALHRREGRLRQAAAEFSLPRVRAVRRGE